MEDVLCKLRELQIQSGVANESTKTTEAKAAKAAALNDLLDSVSRAPKAELPESTRAEVDSALVELGVALKWPLIRSLERAASYRALLGLPRTMEQTRRYLTTVADAKLRELFDQGLADDVAKCADSQTLVWVEEVLAFMTGAGRFKKDLGGFELRGQGKNIVKAAINRTKKRRKELEKQSAPAAERKSNARQKEYVMDRDVRLEDREREQARSVSMAKMLDQSLSIKSPSAR